MEERELSSITLIVGGREEKLPLTILNRVLELLETVEESGENLTILFKGQKWEIPSKFITDSVEFRNFVRHGKYATFNIECRGKRGDGTCILIHELSESKQSKLIISNGNEGGYSQS